MIQCRAIPMALIVLGLCTPSSAQSGNGLAEQFLAEAPVKWRELQRPESLPPCYRAEAERTERRRLTGKPEVVRRSKFMTRSGGPERSVSTLEEESGGGYSGQVVGLNSRYAFFLTRGGAGSPWALGAIDLHPSPDTDGRIAGRLLHGTWETVFTWLVLNPNVDLPDLVGRPTFRISQATTPDSTRPSLVRIEFTCTNKVKQVLDERYAGWIEFDRSRYWAPVSYRFNLTGIRGGTGICDAEYAYIDHPKGLPVPTLIRTHISGADVPGGPQVDTWTDLVQRFDEGDCVSERECTLPAFGLPEPEGVAPPRNPIYWWLIGGGAVVFLTGLVIVRRRQHQRATG